MAGEHIAALRKAVAGMSFEDVASSRDEWGHKVKTLEQITDVVTKNRTGVLNGFGTKSATGKGAVAALDGMNKNVSKRKTQLRDGHAALSAVYFQMTEARRVLGEMPTSAPGEAPTFDPTEAGDTVQEVADALAKYAKKALAHQAVVNSYAESDEEALKQLNALNTAYDNAAAVFAAIGGPPPDDGNGDDGSGDDDTTSGTGPGGSMPRPRKPDEPDLPDDPDGPDLPDDPDDPDLPDEPDNPDNPDDPDRPDDPDLPDDPDHPDNPDDPDLPDDPDHPGDPRFPKIDLTGPAPVGLGILGGLGARNLLSGAPMTVPGQATPRPLGTSARTPGSGVLGRSGVPGQAVGRGGAGGRGAGGRSSGIPGSTGARRGRKGGRDEQGTQSDEYDVEDDWTEDDGQYPGVLG